MKRISATSLFSIMVLPFLSLLLSRTSNCGVEARLTMHRIDLEKTAKNAQNRELLVEDDHYRAYHGNIHHDPGFFHPPMGSFSYLIKKKSKKSKSAKSSHSLYNW